MSRRYSRRSVRHLSFDVGLHGCQQFSVLYDDCLVALDGLALFAQLRACRIRLARGKVTDEDEENVGDHPPFKKWSLSKSVQSAARKHACVGAVKPSYFDQLTTASLKGGPDALTRLSMPLYCSYLTVGRKNGNGPFLAQSWQDSAVGRPVITDAIYGLAGRLKNTVQGGLFGFLGGNRSEKSRKANKPPPEEVLPVEIPIRSAFRDGNRAGEGLFPGPTVQGRCRFVAVCDSHARVLLVDANDRAILRIWKGYRDAECCWLRCKGGSSSERSSSISSDGIGLSSCLFLAIFSPRRGLLEVWSVVNGPRVAAFNVDRYGKLLTAPTSLILGAASDLNDDVGDSESFDSSLLFVDSSGSVQKVDVSFHLALQDTSTTKSHDTDLLKRFQTRLTSAFRRQQFENANEIANSLTEDIGKLKTTSARRSAVDCTIFEENAPPTVVAQVLDGLSSTAGSCGASRGSVGSGSGGTPRLKMRRQQSVSVEERLLKVYCAAALQLVNGYVCVMTKNGDPIPVVVAADNDFMEGTDDDWPRLLSVEENESAACRVVFADFEAQPTNKSSSSADEVSLPVLLSCFDFERSLSSQEQAFGRDRWLKFLFDWEKATGEKVDKFACFLYSRLFGGAHSLPYFSKTILPSFGLSPMDNLRIFLRFWLSTNCAFGRRSSLVLLHDVVDLLFSFCDEVGYESLVSTVFNELTRSAMNGRQHPQTLMLALVVRRLSRTLPTNGVDRETTNVVNWEVVQLNAENWDVLVKDLISLSNFQLLWQSAVDIGIDGNLVVDCNSRLSLRDFIQTPNFCRSEIGRWLAIVSEVVDVDEILERLFEVGDDSMSTATDFHEVILRRLISTRRWLSRDNLSAEVCWELSCAWNREPEKVELLRRSIDILTNVDCPKLRHGVALLQFEMHVKPRFVALCQLIEKVGRCPKDRLCRKEVGVSEMRISSFADVSRLLLRSLADANADFDYSPSTDRIEVGCEENHSDLFLSSLGLGNSSGPLPKEGLCELAVKKRCTNYHLILHHVHLSTVVRCILEGTADDRFRPMAALFDEKGRRAFFDDFHSHPLLPIADVDDRLRTVRRRFCEAATETLTATNLTSTWDNSLIDAIYDLAKDWNVPLDGMRCKQAALMYSICSVELDNEAEKLLFHVKSRRQLVNEVLPVFRQRLIRYLRRIGQSESILDRSSLLSQISSEWLRRDDDDDDGDGSGRSFECAESVERLRQLLAQIGQLRASVDEGSIVGDRIELIIKDSSKLLNYLDTL